MYNPYIIKLEELEKNGEKYNFQEIAESIYKWDEDAVHRNFGALKRTKDSVYIDTTNLNEEELTKIVIEKIKEKYRKEYEL